MQGRVRLLDESTVNKIAAGEVVERPASVVKELVENSIDAEAKRISISITDGGIRSIAVVDDGVGMDQEDALLALERHATSKIREADDLLDVMTLGFRGEALPSIAAVSRLVMITRTAGSSKGTRISVEGGGKATVSDHPAAPGTSVTVADLFYNVPARRKYLKQPTTEARRVIEAVTGEALAHPEIAFTLVSNDRRVLLTSGSADLYQTLAEILGLETAKSLVRFAGGTASTSVHGFVSRPSESRSGRRDLVLVVNGRPVWNGLLISAVTRAYGAALPSGRFPLGAVVIETDPRQVDVNVHPAKTEVRFADEQALFSLVTRTVASVVKSGELTGRAASLPHSATVQPASVWPSRGPAPDRGPMNHQPVGLFAADGPMMPLSLMEDHQVSKTTEPAEGFRAARPDAYAILGQLWDSYILASSDDQLLLIDQHAAMERLQYDVLLGRFRAGGIDSQEVLMPDTIILSPSEAEVIAEHQETLMGLGFRLEPFGMRAYLIRGIPVALDREDGEEALREVLTSLCDESGMPTKGMLSDALVNDLCARLACRSVLKASQRLSHEEMQRLLDDLFTKATSLFCPHGRPVLISYTRGDIERRLGRK